MIEYFVHVEGHLPVTVSQILFQMNFDHGFSAVCYQFGGHIINSSCLSACLGSDDRLHFLSGDLP